MGRPAFADFPNAPFQISFTALAATRHGSSFWRDAKTSTRDARATRNLLPRLAVTMQFGFVFNAETRRTQRWRMGLVMAPISPRRPKHPPAVRGQFPRTDRLDAGGGSADESRSERRRRHRAFTRSSPIPALPRRRPRWLGKCRRRPTRRSCRCAGAGRFAGRRGRPRGPRRRRALCSGG